MSAWLLAIANVTLPPPPVEKQETFECGYAHCNNTFTKPVNAPRKAYCCARCRRDARYLRDMGHPAERNTDEVQ